MAVNSGDWKSVSGDLEIEIGMDSCAAESVIPPDYVDAPITESEGSRRGVFYRGAGGDKIFNEGEQRVEFFTERNDLMALTFQVAKVPRPLASLMKLIKHGNRVVLDEEGSYLMHKATGTVTPIREKRGVFIMHARIKKNMKAKSKISPTGFARQGS